MGRKQRRDNRSDQADKDRHRKTQIETDKDTDRMIQIETEWKDRRILNWADCDRVETTREKKGNYEKKTLEKGSLRKWCLRN